MWDDIREILSKFLETTGLRGVPRIVKSTTRPARAMWFLSVAACSVAMLYQTFTLLVNFNNREVYSNLIEVQTRPQFPDVTICKTSPYRAFESFPETYEDYLNTISQLLQNGGTNQSESYTGVMWEELTSSNQSDSYTGMMWEELSSTRAYIVNNMAFPKRSYASQEDNFVVDYFWYDWQFAKLPHVEISSDILVRWNSQYYKCYTFRPGWNEGVLGLNAILYVENFPPDAYELFNFYVELAMAEGVRLVVHAPGTEPNLPDGIDISPGRQVLISAIQKNLTRARTTVWELHPARIPGYAGFAQNSVHDRSLPEPVQTEAVRPTLWVLRVLRRCNRTYVGKSRSYLLQQHFRQNSQPKRVTSRRSRSGGL